jgi:hypothetical protein
MANEDKTDNLKDSLLVGYDALPREYRIKLVLYLIDLIHEYTEQRKKEIRDKEFNRQIKAAAAAKLYIC